MGLEQLVARIHDAAIVTDAAGTIVLWNRAAETLFGYAAAEVLGRPVNMLMPARLRDHYHTARDHFVGTDQGWPIDSGKVVEMPAVHKTGRELVVELTLSLIDPAPHGRSMLAVVRDMGERWRAAAAQTRLQQEQEFSRLKDELIAVLSHELRTPITTLAGFAELLRDRQYSEAQRQQFYETMVQEGHRLTTLLDDILTLQHLTRGGAPVRPVEADLGPMLIAAASEAMAGATQRLVLDIPTHLPAVSIDAARVSQLVQHLIANARKYSPDGSEITVAARVLDGHVEVSVADRGVGVPAAHLDDLFKRFFRVEPSDHRTSTGAGLGLALCRRIVEVHGGRIWAESGGLGQGARFTFSLPVAPADATAPSTNPARYEPYGT